MKGRCPACNEPSAPEHQPFCSRGCKDRDLLRWLDDGYRIPGRSEDFDGVDKPDPAD